jgi:ATP-dependent RNA helicase RhlE
MFDMGFINDVRAIVARVPAKRQTLLFSATMSKEVRALVASIQKNPELIEIGERRQPVETVRQIFYTVPRETKLGLLLHMLRTQQMESVLVFVRTKHGADKIARRLERNGLRSVALHSNRTQAQRERALAGFRGGSTSRGSLTSSITTRRHSRKTTSTGSAGRDARMRQAMPSRLSPSKSGII